MSVDRSPRSATECSIDDRIRSGIGGWNFAPWRGVFYPEGLARKNELEYASRVVRTIEINSTFYRAQTAEIYAKWREATPPGFVFALKAPRYLTHRKRLSEAGAAIETFITPLAALGDRLGPINWQLAPNTSFDVEDIAAFFAALPKRAARLPLRHAIEVRHSSFVCAEFVELARNAGVAIVCADSDKYPSVADATADFVYLRLMRSDASVTTGYDYTALDTWVARSRDWARGDAALDLPHLTESMRGSMREVFVFFINGAKIRAPAAAVAFAERIAAKTVAVRRNKRDSASR